MKDINLFTDEIIEKVKAKKKKKARKVLLISSVSCLVIAFLIMYSNIIPLYGYDYEKYTSIMINEVYASDDEKTIFTFTNEKNAIFSINNVPYSLRTTNNKNNEYEFDATKIENVEKEKNMQEYLDKTTIKIEFKEGGATIKANVYGIDLNIDVKIYKNTKMESGVWKYFNKDNPNVSSVDSYIIVDEEGKTYYISNVDVEFTSTYEVLFISVFNKDYTILLDNYGVPNCFIEIEKSDYNEYGFETIKFTEYYGQTDSGLYGKYFRKLKDSEIMDYNLCELSANFIKSSKKIEYLGKNDLAKYLPIKWRLFLEEEYNNRLTGLTVNLKPLNGNCLELTVTENNKSTKYSGKYFLTDKNIIVVLDEYSIFGKVFKIFKEKGETFTENGKSCIMITDGFKVGYHDFTYYLTKTKYTVFWGSNYTEDTVNNKLKYETEFILEGEFNKYYYNKSLPFGYETENLIENGKVKLVLHENNTLDLIYEDRTRTINYTLIEGESEYLFELNERIYFIIDESKPIIDNGRYIKTSKLYYKDGVFEVPKIMYYSDYGIIENCNIKFK